MRNRRRNTVTFVIDKWECSSDPQLTQILKALERFSSEMTGPNWIPRFVDKVIGWKASPELRLELFRFIIDRNMLDQVSLQAPNKSKEYQRLERAYQRLFKEWWRSQETHFRSLPSVERIHALREYGSQLPEKLDFSAKLKKDFDLAVAALIQSTEHERDLLLPVVNEPPPVQSTESIPAIDPIPWIGPKNELIELFNILIRQKKIPAVTTAERNRYIEEHFVDKQRNPFTRKNLGALESVTKDTYTGRPKGIHALEGEIEMMLEQSATALLPEDE